MLTIITNNVPRELISLADLNEKERAEFDYIDEDESYSPRLFHYRGSVYDSHEFMHVSYNPELVGKWHGIQSDSFFSGIVIRYADDYETVIVGRYLS